jgi:hypothetical protein
MASRKMRKGQMIYQALHKKLKIGLHEPHLQSEENSCGSEGPAENGMTFSGPIKCCLKKHRLIDP